MPTRNQSGKPEHLFQNPNRKRKKSNQKYKKAMQWFLAIEKKAEKPGMAKWAEQTMKKCMERIRKYGITPAQIFASQSLIAH